MIKVCFTSLLATVLVVSAAAAQAKPNHSSIVEARAKMASTQGKYMRLDQGFERACADVFDGGENRFDRMYGSIGPRSCNPRY